MTPGRRVQLFVVVAASYSIGSEMTQRWFDGGSPGATFFPAAGVTVAALILCARREWPVILIAAGCAELVMDHLQEIAPLPSIGYMAANLGEATVGAASVLAFARRPRLDKPRDLAAFVACGAIAAPIVGAIIGATVAQLAKGQTGWLDFAVQWWAGDALGVLVVGGAALAIARSRRRRKPRLVQIEAAALILATAITTLLCFSTETAQLAIASLVFFYWTALRVGTWGVAIAGGAIAFLAAEAVASGHAFIDVLDVPASSGLVYVQLLVGLVVTTGYALAAEVRQREIAVIVAERAERRRVEADNEAQQTRLLQMLAEQVALADSPRQIASIVVDRSAEAFAADTCYIALHDVGRDKFEIAAAKGYGPEHEAIVAALVDRRAATTASEALRTNRATWFERRAERESDPRFRDVRLLPMDLAAGYALPLRTGRRIVGVISWGFLTERAFDARFRAMAEAMASHYALAIERATLATVKREFADELQRQMLPVDLALPAPVQVAAKYVAGEYGLEVGGDWYDALMVREGTVGVAIGDVVGRGLEASVAMGQLRSAVSALAPTCGSAAEMIEHLDGFAARLSAARYSTALWATLDLYSGRLDYSCAAHMPPVLFGNSRSELLMDGRSAPLCANFDRPRKQASVMLEPGNTLLLFTDGLIERPSTPLDAGLDRVLDITAELSDEPPNVIADQLIEQLYGRGGRDDAAVLALKLEGTLPTTRRFVAWNARGRSSAPSAS